MRPPSLLLAAALAGTLVAAARPAPAVDGASGPSPPGCLGPPQLLTIGAPLTHVAARLARHEPLTVVALGSSSTQGVGASTAALNYPSRLQAELATVFPEVGIRVVNRGRGGEEAPQMVTRIATDVVGEHPDLVIWQLGTNAVLRHDDVDVEEAPLERGLLALKASGADIVLMDMQYAPRVLTRPGHDEIERLLADTAKRERVGFFRRFALMRAWQTAHPEAASWIGPDGLHMNDRGYACLAADLARAIALNLQTQQAAIAKPSDGSRIARFNTAPITSNGP